MNYQRNGIGRRSFLCGTAVAVATVGGFSTMSAPVAATSDAIGDEQWTHPRGTTASTAYFPASAQQGR